MNSLSWKIPAILAAAVFAVFTQPVAADESIELDKDVRVKIIKCEGEECSEKLQKLTAGEGFEVVAAADLAELTDLSELIDLSELAGLAESSANIVIRKLHCDGDDCEHNQGHHKTIFVGDGGDVQLFPGGEGHTWLGAGGNFHHFGDFGGGFLGVGLTELTPELRRHFGVSEDAGVMVAKVMEDSPAFRAGVEVGDIITAIDGDSVAGGSELAKVVRGKSAGEEVELEIWRAGSVRSITAAVEERETSFNAWKTDDIHKGLRKIMVRCESDDEDCRSNVEIAGLNDFDCGDSEDCRITVDCEDDGCDCEVNGESVDCADIPGVPGH